MPRPMTRAATTGLLLLAALVPTSAAPAGAVVGSSGALAALDAPQPAPCPAPGGVAVPEAPTPVSGALVVQGHGWGHSLGLSQYGAQGAARLGCSATTILSTYYPGTTLARQPTRPAVSLRLMASEPAGRSTVAATRGDLTWVAVAARKTLVQPQGQTWTVRRRADKRGVVLLDATGAERFWVDSNGFLDVQQRGSTARVRSFGGATGATLRTDLRLRLDDTRFRATSLGLSAEQVLRDDAVGTGVQKYLWGLAEVPASWPAAALQAQAIAARTYLVAGFADATDTSTYRIGTTTATQHYGGAKHEDEDATAGGAWRAAVDATAGLVVTTPDGAPIDAVFTSSHGGRSEDVRYVWGGPEVPYLTAVDDSRWDQASDNPFTAWSLGLTQKDVARRFGFDQVSDVRVADAAAPERLAGVVVTGTRAGVTSTRTLTGYAARLALGVRSPSFTLRWLLPQTGQPLAGDFDGDQRGDVGWFAGGRVTLLTATGVRRSYALGTASSRAVVGDWDGNGKDSVAVVDGTTWCLRNLVRSGPCDATFAFGAPTDVPVAGRWHGGRADGIGVFRSGRWFLRDTASAGASDVRMSWGRPGDAPVVGDWDGDGTDSHGVVRAGTWFLGGALVSGSPSTQSFAYGGASDRFVVGTWSGGRRSLPGAVAGSSFFLRTSDGTGTSTRRITVAP